MNASELVSKIEKLESEIKKNQIAIKIAKDKFIEENRILSEGDIISSTKTNEKWEVVGDAEFGMDIEGNYSILYPCIMLKKNGQLRKIGFDGIKYSAYYRRIPQSGFEKLIYVLSER